jgi:hypothetical protein
MRMTVRGSALLYACAAAILGLGPSAPGSSAAWTADSVMSDTIPFQRLPRAELRIAKPGWAVIDDSVKWATLWHVYGVESFADDGRVLVQPSPPIDFRRDQVLAVSFGATSGCGGSAAFVMRVTEHSRERLVEIDPHDFLDDGPCAMIVYPVDFVTVPRSPKRVRLRRALSADTSVALPPAAEWWIPLSVSAALDTGRTPRERLRHELSLRTLPRDSTLPLDDYRRLAAAAYAARQWETQMKLLQNPRAGGDKVVLGWLAAGGELPSARQVPFRFLARYGLEVASDPEAAGPWLEVLMRTLTDGRTRGADRVPGYPDVALALTRNPALLADSVLASRLTYATQWYPEIHADACRAYLARHRSTLVFQRDSTGRPTTTRTANCR